MARFAPFESSSSAAAAKPCAARAETGGRPVVEDDLRTRLRRYRELRGVAHLIQSCVALVLLLVGAGISAAYDRLAPDRSYPATFLGAEAVHELEPSRAGSLDVYWVVAADGRRYRANDYYDYYLALWASNHRAPLRCVIHRPTPKVIFVGGHGWQVCSCHAGRR